MPADVPALLCPAVPPDVGALQSRQPDSRTYRLWEATGTAHFDLYGLTQGATDTGDRRSTADWFASMQHPTNQPGPNFTCDLPINSGPQTFVLRSAVAHLDRWVARGTPPPRAPRLQTISVQPAQYAVDAHGIVRSCGSGVTLIPWSDVSAIRRYPRGYLMVLKRGTLPIPYRCLAGAQASAMDGFAVTLRPAARR